MYYNRLYIKNKLELEFYNCLQEEVNKNFEKIIEEQQRELNELKKMREKREEKRRSLKRNV